MFLTLFEPKWRTFTSTVKYSDVLFIWVYLKRLCEMFAKKQKIKQGREIKVKCTQCLIKILYDVAVNMLCMH